jgi:uncharacterized protein
MNIQKLKQVAAPIFSKHHVIRASLFGSTARGEDNNTSDVDILVELPNGLNLFSFVEIKLDLEDSFGKNVDLVQYKKIKPALKKSIFNEQLPIYPL